MKYAAAMRFGGQLVEAIACDYNDYKYLGLLCPACKDPIFLRAESVRFAGEKEIKISPHFSHFPAKDATLAKICEQRVAQYTEAEIQKRVSQARGQRLKFFQRWFWDCLMKICYGKMPDHLEEDIKNFPDKVTKACLGAVVMLEHELKPEHKGDFMVILRVLFHDIVSQNKEGCHRIRNSINNLGALDVDIHLQIVSEAVDFLVAKRQQALLRESVASSIFTGAYLSSLVIDEDSFNSFLDIDGLENLDDSVQYDFFFKASRYVFEVFLRSLLLVPWADEFAAIQKQESDRSLSKVA